MIIAFSTHIMCPTHRPVVDVGFFAPYTKPSGKIYWGPYGTYISYKNIRLI